jgi:hypothetical protein
MIETKTMRPYKLCPVCNEHHILDPNGKCSACNKCEELGFRPYRKTKAEVVVDPGVPGAKQPSITITKIEEKVVETEEVQVVELPEIKVEPTPLGAAVDLLEKQKKQDEEMGAQTLREFHKQKEQLERQWQQRQHQKQQQQQKEQQQRQTRIDEASEQRVRQGAPTSAAVLGRKSGIKHASEAIQCRHCKVFKYQCRYDVDLRPAILNPERPEILTPRKTITAFKCGGVLEDHFYLGNKYLCILCRNLKYKKKERKRKSEPKTSSQTQTERVKEIQDAKSSILQDLDYALQGLAVSADKGDKGKDLVHQLANTLRHLRSLIQIEHEETLSNMLKYLSTQDERLREYHDQKYEQMWHKVRHVLKKLGAKGVRV